MPSVAPFWRSRNGQAAIYCGDAQEVLRTLPEKSVHCVVTSPPYWMLRDYGIEGQYGLEPTPEEYVARMVEVFREVRRVLRDDGTLWLNLGDSYARDAAKGQHKPGDAGLQAYIYDQGGGRASVTADLTACGLKPKDLVGIPWMVAFALRNDGWWLRSDVIWAKGVSGDACKYGWSGNPMPESVTDRPTSAHEHVFLLAKSERYFYDADAVREPYDLVSIERYRTLVQGVQPQDRQPQDCQPGHKRVVKKHLQQPNLAGRNLRDVWTITTKPFTDAHFATFPPDLVRWSILAGTSEEGCCSACGAPYQRVTARHASVNRDDAGRTHALAEQRMGKTAPPERGWQSEIETVAWQASCTCGAPRKACVVLDPFVGSGTTAAVAVRYGRNAIGIDLNPDYCKIAGRRVYRELYRPRLSFDTEAADTTHSGMKGE